MRKSFRGHNQKPTGPKEFRINSFITAPELMIIDDAGNNLGVISREQALAEARERELDLVEVSPKAVPPIAKYIDFGSYKYQREKQERKAKAKQKTMETKTVKITFRIAAHDLEIRANQAADFLSEGHKVRIEIQLRGRENQHSDLARENIRKMIDLIKQKLAAGNQEGALKVDPEITRQGGKLSINISI